MQNHFSAVIERFNSCSVLVIGDAILDTYIRGAAERLCREAPAPVLTVLAQDHSCGGAANTAINLAALGAKTFLLTAVGCDENGRSLLHLLRNHGVRTHCVVQDAAKATLAKKRITAAGTILLRLDEGQKEPVSEVVEAKLCRSMTTIYPRIDAVVISDYGYGLLTEGLLRQLANLQDQHAKPLIVDSRELPRFKRFAPTLVKPNYEESLQLLGLPKAEPGQRVYQVTQGENAYYQRTGAKSVAVTLDSDGAVLLRPGCKPHHLLAVPRDNKNSVGAGDTFLSAMTLALTVGADALMAAEVGAGAAAVVMQKEGTSVCMNDELKSYFNDNPKFAPSLSWLADKVRGWKNEGKRIVFTNGCFDILHTGHISILSQAKALGDVLLVALNSDESIRRLKGKDRPINTLKNRIIVLSALQSVDYLITFDQDTVTDLVKAIQPDFFVKGANYSSDTLPEATLVEQIGGKVIFFPLHEGDSTTKLIAKICAVGSYSTAETTAVEGRMI